MPDKFGVGYFLRAVAEGTISLKPRGSGCINMRDVAMIYMLEKLPIDNQTILEIHQTSASPPHLDVHFENEWRNNLLNRIIHAHWCKKANLDPGRSGFTARQMFIDAHINNALAFSDSEDDAFSA